MIVSFEACFAVPIMCVRRRAKREIPSAGQRQGHDGVLCASGEPSIPGYGLHMLYEHKLVGFRGSC